ncbi:FecR domain-containing protein [Calycomorphotria hydatis]|uniref:FecR protein n=1 Tax=Calycomorphotria hydatis TaxID=2528027 RepID=A0A517TD88_9PLAN|nr:FecR domain-containing protein [Calycomorphotria hydatis]QDT66338.1 FecR protein [Calycomorphotria hydatis]
MTNPQLDRQMDGIANRVESIQFLKELVAQDNAVFETVSHVEVGTQIRESANQRDLLSYFVVNTRSVSRQNCVRYMLLGAICSVATVLLFGLALTLIETKPPEAGKLIGLTADAKWSGREYVPGDLVLERMTVTLEAGIATFELADGAVVSLQGPATIEATSGQSTNLINGLLHAVVPPEAIGYTVRTVDAKVVDLGTEFLVERGNKFGTRVAVKRGKVEARLIEGNGRDSAFELTAGRAMEFQTGIGLSKELANSNDWNNQFAGFDNAGGGIARLEGIVRTTPSLPADLRPGKMPTNNYVMLVRECAGIELTEDLTIQQNSGSTTIPAGSTVDSYLLHFDPESLVHSTAPPIGTITFGQPIFAVIGHAEDLLRTDDLCSEENSRYASDSFRGLEFPDDHIEISADRKSVSFHLLRSSQNEMDQCRILIRSHTSHVESDLPGSSTHLENVN